MQQTTLRVEGMSCGHCVNTVEGSVGKLNGVEAVQVNLAEKKVEVTFDENAIRLQDIADVIEEQGYDVEQPA